MNIALLRAVAHVLDKVDGARSPQHRQAISEVWPALKAAEIFAKFIERERNNVLKEYKLGATHAARTSLASSVVYAGRGQTQFGRRRVVFSYPVLAKPFDGLTQPELIAQAIEFLSGHLDAIDRRITELQASSADSSGIEP